MGAWGPGLYDNDFALDLKATIKGLLRAPLTEDEVLAELKASCGDGLEGLEAHEYWLVLADQLERRGIPRRDVFERAITVIEAGHDIAMLEQLEADPKAFRNRRRETADLLVRLREPRPAKPRNVLKKPQPFVLEPGQALIWPTDRGNSINPYVAEEARWKLGGFNHDGWGFGVVTDAGHQFHVLAFYAVQVMKWRREQRPSLDLAVHCPRSPHQYGTIRNLHLKRAQVERIGSLPEAAMAPPPEGAYAQREARRVVVWDVGLSSAFGYDAWNHFVVPGPKFVVPAPSGTPLDADEPDQRPGASDQS